MTVLQTAVPAWRHDSLLDKSDKMCSRRHFRTNKFYTVPKAGWVRLELCLELKCVWCLVSDRRQEDPFFSCFDAVICMHNFQMHLAQIQRWTCREISSHFVPLRQSINMIICGEVWCGVTGVERGRLSQNLGCERNDWVEKCSQCVQLGPLLYVKSTHTVSSIPQIY